jgi:hypothetical protein
VNSVSSWRLPRKLVFIGSDVRRLTSVIRRPLSDGH